MAFPRVDLFHYMPVVFTEQWNRIPFSVALLRSWHVREQFTSIFLLIFLIWASKVKCLTHLTHQTNGKYHQAPLTLRTCRSQGNRQCPDLPTAVYLKFWWLEYSHLHALCVSPHWKWSNSIIAMTSHDRHGVSNLRQFSYSSRSFIRFNRHLSGSAAEMFHKAFRWKSLTLRWMNRNRGDNSSHIEHHVSFFIVKDEFSFFSCQLTSRN